MSATVTSSAFTAGERFEMLCYSMAPDAGLFGAALEALGIEGWAVHEIVLQERRVLQHRSGRVRVSLDDGVFTVKEFDPFSFEVGTTVFRGDRRVQGPRALRFASMLAAEVAR